MTQVRLISNNFSSTSPCLPCFVHPQICSMLQICSIYKSDMSTSWPLSSAFLSKSLLHSFNKYWVPTLCHTCSRHWGYCREQDHQTSLLRELAFIAEEVRQQTYQLVVSTMKKNRAEWGDREDRGGILNRVVKKGLFEVWPMNWDLKEVREWTIRIPGDRIFKAREW